MPDSERSNYSVLFLGSGALLLFLAGLIIYLHLLPYEEAKVLLREDGPIEMTSAVLWMVAASVLLGMGFAGIWRDGWAASALFFAFGLRELDFHKKFTVMSVDKIKFYWSPQVPMVEKIPVLILMVFLLYLAIRLIRGNWRPLMEGLKERDPLSIFVLTGILLLPFSKILDRFPNALKEWGMHVRAFVTREVGMFEEVLEMGIPLFLLLIMMQVFLLRKKSV